VPNVGAPEIFVIIATFAVMILIVAAAYALIVLLARALHGSASDGARDPAMDALRTRLAKGEIDDREYERLRSVLQGR
jgi:uncharacterized membrane protein